MSTRPVLRYRQVHLDFHTSEQIPNIGGAFDPDAFADALVRAHIDSITCFARCHHGWIYFDTERFPERRHPYLVRDLLREQIEACHARGIRVPIYVTVQWDQYTANAHPEWLALNADGRISGTAPYEAGFYRRLCVNSPYFDFLKAHVAEIFERLPVDGFFFDIVQPLDDSSKWTRAAMLERGLDPEDAAARRAYGVTAIQAFERDMTAHIRGFDSDCTIFYNSGHIAPRHRATQYAYSHFEIESLPSGSWGYVHFSLAARYARTLDRPLMGMTGKFHTSWGDFHSYKNRAALEYECFRMLALGATCSIGDQLLPSGAVDPATLDLIGAVYAQVERKEAWCQGAQSLAEIAVFSPEQFTGERIPAPASGAVRMLEEAGYEFDFIDTDADLARYRLLILPDVIAVDVALAAKLSQFTADGGALIASYRSGLNPAGDAFALTDLGVSLVGDAPYQPDFLLPCGDFAELLPRTEHVMYERGLQVAEQPGTDVLATMVASYFNRTWRHFHSHRHAPSRGDVIAPAITQCGRAIYFSHPIFTQYESNAPRWVKTLLVSAITRLIGAPRVCHNGPSTLLTSLTEQPDAARFVLHALHYIPVRRSHELDVIEDVIPLHALNFRVRLERAVTNVRSVPDDAALAFEQHEGDLIFTLPRLDGHAMIEIMVLKGSSLDSSVFPLSARAALP